MGWLGNAKFTALLIAAGLVLIVLGITGGFTISGYQIVAHSVAMRIVAGAFGICIIGVAVGLEFPHIFSNLLSSTDSGAAPRAKAEDVLHTLDDDAHFAFHRAVEDADRVSIYARTAVNLLNTYQQTFLELGRSGVTIRLLCVDPESEACRTIYGGEHAIYVHNVQTTERILSTLKQRIGNRLEIKVTRHAPTFGLIIVERSKKQESSVDVQFYFLHALTGRDRPILRVQPSDKWFHPFVDEFAALWKEANDWVVDIDKAKALPYSADV